MLTPHPPPPPNDPPELALQAVDHRRWATLAGLDARMLRQLGKLSLCQCFRISGFRNFGETEIWQLSGNLRCKNTGRDYKNIDFDCLRIPHY